MTQSPKMLLGGCFVTLVAWFCAGVMIAFCALAKWLAVCGPSWIATPSAKIGDSDILYSACVIFGVCMVVSFVAVLIVVISSLED